MPKRYPYYLCLEPIPLSSDKVLNDHGIQASSLAGERIVPSVIGGAVEGLNVAIYCIYQ